jgi:hypothetical protein
MSAGRPVIAFAGGGALESVVAGQTGVFFGEQTPDSVKEAINHFQTLKFDSQKIRKHAEKFSKERFKKELNEFIQAKLKVQSDSIDLEAVKTQLKIAKTQYNRSISLIFKYLILKID